MEWGRGCGEGVREEWNLVGEVSSFLFSKTFLVQSAFKFICYKTVFFFRECVEFDQCLNEVHLVENAVTIPKC